MHIISEAPLKSMSIVAYIRADTKRNKSFIGDRNVPKSPNETTLYTQTGASGIILLGDTKVTDRKVTRQQNGLIYPFDGPQLH